MNDNLSSRYDTKPHSCKITRGITSFISVSRPLGTPGGPWRPPTLRPTTLAQSARLSAATTLILTSVTVRPSYSTGQRSAAEYVFIIILRLVETVGR